MLNITQAMAGYIKEKGIQISTISESTKIPSGKLYNSFSGTRQLRADEYMAICGFLEKSPFDFIPQIETSTNTGQQPAA
jgi:hypothetical protein